MTKYVAFKVEGINHWLWFETEKVTRQNGKVVCRDGWGKGGTYTNLDIDESCVEGRLDSEELQYSADYQ